MFQKKDYIYSETMGVCLVSDVTSLAPKKGTAVPYYVLRSVYEKDKVAYIPVDHHVVELRELISLEEAKELAAEWKLSVTDEVVDMQEDAEMVTEIPEGMTEEQFRLRRKEAEFVIRREEIITSKKKHKKEDRP